MNEIKGFFDEYAKFVDDVTSEIGKKDELFMERAAEISRWLDGNFSRMPCRRRSRLTLTWTK